MVETVMPRAISAGIRLMTRVVLPLPLQPATPKTFMVLSTAGLVPALNLPVSA
jgi:hypothetical protein